MSGELFPGVRRENVLHPLMASTDVELTETNRRHSPDTPRQTITTTVFLGGPSVKHGRFAVVLNCRALAAYLEILTPPL